jgi:DNA modification methylase
MEASVNQRSKLPNVEYVPLERLKPNSRNARTHTPHQIRQIAASLGEFGFVNPILVDQHDVIIAGHGRWNAARRESYDEVPILRLEHLTPDQVRAYVLSDNRLAEKAGWDVSILAIELQHLSNAELNFDVTVTGFEAPEIDLILGGTSGQNDKDDEIAEGNGLPAVTQLGDTWHLGRHIVACASALDQHSYDLILEGAQTDIVFTDPPYNVPITGHVSGKGRIRLREFPMASGEMGEVQFAEFLVRGCTLLAANSRDGAMHFICMDWAHADLMHQAGKVYSALKSICVWVKDNGGMGSLYRSQHEFIFVFKKGSAPHTNNVQLGKFGRNRTNVWNYPGPAGFGRAGEEGHLAALHPTVKPVCMIADALIDCSGRGDIVLDPFLGSGSTLIAAERVGRKCRGMDLDPLYVDVAIRRWQRHSGDCAVHAQTGRRFDELAEERADG